MTPTATLLRACSIMGSAAVLLAQTPDASAIPRGTQISVRTIDAIESSKADVGQSYRCTLAEPVSVAGKELASKGADCVLRIVETKSAGRLRGKNELKLVVSEIRMGDNLTAVKAEPAAITGKSKGKSTARRTGIGAAAGAGLGAILGGGKGAAIGAGVGAGAGAASAALTSGPEIKVPSETLLTFIVQ